MIGPTNSNMTYLLFVIDTKLMPSCPDMVENLWYSGVVTPKQLVVNACWSSHFNGPFNRHWPIRVSNHCSQFKPNRPHRLHSYLCRFNPLKHPFLVRKKHQKHPKTTRSFDTESLWASPSEDSEVEPCSNESPMIYCGPQDATGLSEDVRSALNRSSISLSKPRNPSTSTGTSIKTVNQGLSEKLEYSTPKDYPQKWSDIGCQPCQRFFDTHISWLLAISQQKSQYKT